MDKTIDDYSFLFTSSEKSGYGGVKFMMTTEDAKKFCSDNRSKGNMWAYFFTSIKNHILANNTKPYPAIDLSSRIHGDNGSFDWLIEELGLEKIPLSEAAKIISGFGIPIKVRVQKEL